MTPVLAQMQCDVIHPALLGQQRRLHRLRIARVTLLAQRRHMIDIQAQGDILLRHALRSRRG